MHLHRVTPARPQVGAAEVVRQARLGGRIHAPPCFSMLVHACPTRAGMVTQWLCLYANEENAFLLKPPEHPRRDGIVSGRSFGTRLSICH
jgi:hypothetical protein